MDFPATKHVTQPLKHMVTIHANSQDGCMNQHCHMPRWCSQQIVSVGQPDCFGLSDEMSLGQIAGRVVFDLTLNPFPAFRMSRDVTGSALSICL